MFSPSSGAKDNYLGVKKNPKAFYTTLNVVLILILKDNDMPPQVCWVLGIFFITLLEIKFTRLLRLCLEWQSLSPEFTRGINLGRTSPVTLLSAGGLEWTYHYKNYLLFFFFIFPPKERNF